MSRYPSSEPTGADNGYFRAKVAQEKLITASGIPYTIIRSTQFLEFLGGIADSSADGNMVRISPGLFQPIAADDVAAIVADVALAAPRNGIVEIAGPERAPFNEIVARYLKAVGDPREVVSDPEARYFGGQVEEHSLVPLGDARLGRIGLDEWLRRSKAAASDPFLPITSGVSHVIPSDSWSGARSRGQRTAHTACACADRTAADCRPHHAKGSR